MRNSILTVTMMALVIIILAAAVRKWVSVLGTPGPRLEPARAE